MRTLAPLLALALALPAPAANDFTSTLMTLPGRLLASEDFAKPLAPLTGNPDSFASGYTGWRYNKGPRAGAWEIVDGAFHGATNEAAHHPAAATYGLEFKNVVIQCELRMDDVPLGGTMGHYMQVRTTGLKGYVCSIGVDRGGLRIQKDDLSGGGKRLPKDKDEDGPDIRVPLGYFKTPVKLGEWQQVVIEILGEEMVATMNGHSLTGTHPLIGSDKHSVMIDFGASGSVRNFKIWEALPNPEWPKNKATIVEAMKGLPLR